MSNARHRVEARHHPHRHRLPGPAIARAVDDPHAAGVREPLDLEAAGDELGRAHQGRV